MSGTVDDSARRGGAEPRRAASHLVVALECDRPASGGARFRLDGLARVTLGRGPARDGTYAVDGGVSTLDLRVPASGLSTSHARLLCAGDDWMIEDTGSRNGTFVNGARVDRAVLRPGDVISVGRVLLFMTSPLLSPASAPRALDSQQLPPRRGHVTLDPELDASLAALERVAPSELSVLIRGETGTGKEVLARAAHDLSGRTGPFVAVNCGAIPPSLVESHLFGHVKGAFSGAVRDEPGVFRAASGGTLFLDEIGDLPRVSQAALLRALQEREVVPVGATRPVKVDLRIVAATHEALEAMTDKGEFRRDLLARLSGFTITLPPLRARRMDIGIVVAALLGRLSAGRPVTLTPEAGLALLRYSFPLNVRELEQTLHRALLLAGDEPIDVTHLPSSLADAARADDGADPTRAPSTPPSRDDALRLQLVSALAAHDGNLTDVARALGKARMQIHRWCKRFGIDPNVYRR